MAADTEWSYEGERGADRWGQIDEKFALCETGIMQSPIDLGKANGLGKLNVSTSYKAAPLTILNNGHTVQVNFPSGSTLSSGDAEFDLLQVHFHTPAEHSTDGKRYPLSAHFVHSDSSGKLAVLGVMFQKGSENSELKKLLNAAPMEKQDAQTIADVSIDPNLLLPEKTGVYRYMGSLTTPPCSEGVNWHVIQQPMQASAGQIEAFTKIMGDNARPVKLLNGRLLIAPEK